MTVKSERTQDLPRPSQFETTANLFYETAGKIFCDAESNNNLIKAKNLWLKSVQKTHYSEEYEFLVAMQGHHCKSISGKKLFRKEKLQIPPLCLNLHLFLDDERIIRVKTSQFNAKNLTYDMRCPVLLPKDSEFTQLLVKEAHLHCGHFGLNGTRSYLRNNYWIPKVATLVKKIVDNCKICALERVQRYHVPDSPPIPEFRFDYDKPFNCTCLDMTGRNLSR